MEKVRATSKSGVLFRIWDDLPYLGGLYSIEVCRIYGDCVCWARPETRCGVYRYELTSDYTKAYVQFLSCINS